ncbi:MAG: hypothetical protein RL199_1066 [Pseudomonadota bacterium]|jgi:glutamate-ammonia-ligase adenylyltransferase
MTPAPSAVVLDEALLSSRQARLYDCGRECGLLLTPDELDRVAPLLLLDVPAGWLERRPRLARWLAKSPLTDAPREAGSFRDALLSRTRHVDPGDVDAFDRLLRLHRQRTFLHIAWRDLTRRAPLSAVTRELSRFADACLEAAIRFHAPAGLDDFCVLAMGKHGGEELNYSSDIDVLFLTRDDAQRDRAVALAQKVIRSLSRVTGDGFVFRVDANLRPYGRDGSLVNSPGELERYYERAGRTWERAALIKARPAAGALGLGLEVVDRLRPFVWRRSLDLAAVEALATMKSDIDAEHGRAGADDVKLGVGGIREIEFYAQSFQLLHGGRKTTLRRRATLPVLESLVSEGLVSQRVRDVLSEAYVFLRDVEHRAQLPNDQQTHAVPPRGSPARTRLAALMGFAEVSAFDAVLDGHRTAVRALFAGLMPAAAERPAHAPEVQRLLASGSDESDRIAALGALGFEDATLAARQLAKLARVDEGPFGASGRERHPELAPRLVEALASAASPDDALLRFAQLAAPLWEPSALSTLLDAQPATLRLLVHLLSSSELLARDFQRHPELLDLLLRSGDALVERPRESIASEMNTRLSAAEPGWHPAVLRRLRHEETLRIGLHDLAGRLDAASVGRQLSALADVLLDAVLALAREEVAGRFGEPHSGGIVVLGLGSLGGEELTYESDLDLVFVHDASGTTSGGTRGCIDAEEWASRVCQRMLSLVTLPTAEGVLYRVDTRLRPSGSAGPLVVSLDAFGRYHRGEVRGRNAELWERQALTRARVVAGEATLGRRVEGEVLDIVSKRPLPEGVGRSLGAMRHALDNMPSHGIDPKKGPGGLLDLDFLAQFFALQRGWRTGSTRAILERLREGALIERAKAQVLLSAWHRLRHVERRLRLMYGRAEVYVPRQGRGIEVLARQLGGAGAHAGEQLVRELVRTMAQVREAFDALVVDGT